MSGRITAIEVDPRNPDRIYAGSASGGLWRSDNLATTWTPIFDDQHSASIGAVAIDPLNSDVIWVASGEANPRNSQSVGTGIYKSIDGGRSWTRLGLEKSEHLHRVLIHPHNTNTVYVCATGPTWSDGEQRGVYKTADGGQSWQKVLYVNESTGCGDLVMDPVNPDKLLAAMWDHRRTPWDFRSGGPGSGLHVTYDGGATWTKRTHEDGLPEGDLGRIGLAIAKSRPEIVYALVEAKKSALYRSEDGGHEWEMVNDSRNIANRLWHYFFGRGLVQPVDQMHSENVPAIPELLTLLADDMAQHGYDLRRTIRILLSSRAYRLDSRWTGDEPPPDAKMFAVARLRPLSRRQLAFSLLLATRDDSFAKATKTEDRAKAYLDLQQQGDDLLRSLDPRVDGFESSAGEALFLTNGEAIQQLISGGENSLAKRLTSVDDDGEIVKAAYQRLLSRDPTPAEVEQLTDWINNQQADRESLCADLAWALLTSAEFRFLH